MGRRAANKKTDRKSLKGVRGSKTGTEKGQLRLKQARRLDETDDGD